MRHLHAAAVCVCCVLALPREASAQDLEIFDVDDFIAPSDLVTPDGKTTFVYTRMMLGFDRNYTRRNELFGEPMQFLRFVNEVHRSNFQFNVNYTHLWTRLQEARPQPSGVVAPSVIPRQLAVDRFGIEAAVYDDDEAEPGRFRLLWNIERQPDGSSLQEWGGVVDLKPNKAVADFGYGALVYRFVPSQHEHAVNFAYRQTVWQNRAGVILMLSEGAGYEFAAGDLRWGVARMQAAFQVPLPLFLGRNDYVQAFYSFGVLPFSHPRYDQFKTPSHEFGAYLNIPVFVSLVR
jgi:hypothetical protein